MCACLCLLQELLRGLLDAEAHTEEANGPLSTRAPRVAPDAAPKKMQVVRVNVMGGPKGPGEHDGVSPVFSKKKKIALLFRALDKLDLLFQKQLAAWRAADSYLVQPPEMTVYAGGTEVRGTACLTEGKL